MSVCTIVARASTQWVVWHGTHSVLRNDLYIMWGHSLSYTSLNKRWCERVLTSMISNKFANRCVLQLRVTTYFSRHNNMLPIISVLICVNENESVIKIWCVQKFVILRTFLWQIPKSKIDQLDGLYATGILKNHGAGDYQPFLKFTAKQ